MATLIGATKNRYYLTRPPRDDEELYRLVQALWGVTIPRNKVCEHHQAPFDAFATAFFAREPQVLVHGSRGLSGKTQMMSVLGLTQAVVLGADNNIVGGSEQQAKNALEHMSKAWAHPDAPEYMLKRDGTQQMTLTNQAIIRPLTASQRSVRGPHPARLLLDEIDEMDAEILESAKGQPMPQKNWLGVEIPAQTTMVSTLQYADGCVAAGTMITTSAGEKKIEDVKVGDRVLTRAGYRPVLATHDNGWKETVTVTFASGRSITCTPDHEVFTADGWVEAALLSPGTQVGVHLRSVLLPVPTSGSVPALATEHVPVGDDSTREGEVVPVLTDALLDQVLPHAVVIRGLGDRLQVTGVNTHPDPAQMVDDLPLRDGSVDQLVYVPMSQDALPLPINGEPAVAVPVGPGSQGPEDALVSVGDHQLMVAEPDHVVDVSHSAMLLHTYDLMVEEHHEYVANGMLIHNTMVKEMARFEEEGLPVMSWCYKDTANPVDGWLSTEFIEQKRREVSRERWRVEYDLGEPSIGNRAFDSSAVERMFADKAPEPVRITREYEEYSIAEARNDRDYVISADWAQAIDWTEIHVYDVTSQPIELVYRVRMQRMPYPRMIGVFNMLQKRYRAEGIHDATGLGRVVSDMLDERVRNFVMAGRERDNMLSEYVGAVERGQIKAPRMNSMYKEHLYCVARGEKVLTRRGHIPIEQVVPDDMVMTRAGWRKVLMSRRTGVKNTVRITTADGSSVRLTHDHRVSTSDGWVEAGSLTPGCLVHTVTGPASTAAARGDLRVLRGELVPTLTEGLRSVLGPRAGSPEAVLPVRDGFEMIGVTASRTTAQVVESESLGDGSDQGDVGRSVGEPLVLGVIPGETTVSTSVGSSVPHPASVVRHRAAGSEVALVDDDGTAAPVTDSAPGGSVHDDDAAVEAGLIGSRGGLRVSLHVLDSITKDAPCEVYDITVEGEHEFVAGGVVVHNCSVEDLYARGKDFHLPDSVCAAGLAWKMVSHKFPVVDPVGLGKGENWMAKHVANNTSMLDRSSPYHLEGEVRSSEDVDELSFT